MANLSPRFFQELDNILAEEMSFDGIAEHIRKFSDILDGKLIEHYTKTRKSENWRVMDAQKLEHIYVAIDYFISSLGGFGRKLFPKKATHGISILLNHTSIFLPLERTYKRKKSSIIPEKSLTFNVPKYAAIAEGILFYVPEKVFGKNPGYDKHFLYARNIDSFPPF